MPGVACKGVVIQSLGCRWRRGLRTWGVGVRTLEGDRMAWGQRALVRTGSGANQLFRRCLNTQARVSGGLVGDGVRTLRANCEPGFLR